VISNSYPVDPVITLVDGMLGVYVPPYARSTANNPKLEIQLVVQVGGLKGGAMLPAYAQIPVLMLHFCWCNTQSGGEVPHHAALLATGCMLFKKPAHKYPRPS
jgi:hypothetical protein